MPGDETDAALRQRLRMCPPWCTSDHDDPDRAADDGICHYAAGPGAHLSDLSHQFCGHRHRENGGSWSTGLARTDEYSGAFGTRLVELNVFGQHGDVMQLALLSMTGGEARSLAAALVSLADRLEELG